MSIYNNETANSTVIRQCLYLSRRVAQLSQRDCATP